MATAAATSACRRWAVPNATAPPRYDPFDLHSPTGSTTIRSLDEPRQNGREGEEKVLKGVSTVHGAVHAQNGVQGPIILPFSNKEILLHLFI